jgi:hypothetical protein
MVLARSNGNKREACRVLDISYHTLQSYLNYGIDSAQEGPPVIPEASQAPEMASPVVVADHRYPPLGQTTAAVHEATSATWPRDG